MPRINNTNRKAAAEIVVASDAKLLVSRDEAAQLFPSAAGALITWSQIGDLQPDELVAESSFLWRTYADSHVAIILNVSTRESITECLSNNAL